MGALLWKSTFLGQTLQARENLGWLKVWSGWLWWKWNRFLMADSSLKGQKIKRYISKCTKLESVQVGKFPTSQSIVSTANPFFHNERVPYVMVPDPSHTSWWRYAFWLYLAVRFSHSCPCPFLPCSHWGSVKLHSCNNVFLLIFPQNFAFPTGDLVAVRLADALGSLPFVLIIYWLKASMWCQSCMDPCVISETVNTVGQELPCCSKPRKPTHYPGNGSQTQL